MEKRDIKEMLYDIAIRCIKTMAEVMLGYISIGMAISDVNWLHLFSVTIMAGLYTILVNLASIQIEASKKNREVK